MESYYDLLGVSPDASPEIIRKAYRSKAKCLHPDHHSGGTAAMAALNQAYEILRDDRRRRAYDRSRKPARRGATPPESGVGDRKPQVDPHAFLVNVFRPADARLKRAVARLARALDELAYDVWDETYLERFVAELAIADAELAEVHRVLRGHPWPEAGRSVLQLYVQGMRLIDDAVGEFRSFTREFDLDDLAFGGDLLHRGRRCLDEATGLWS